MNALEMVNELLSRFGLKEVGSMGASSDATIALRKLNIACQMIANAYPFNWREKTSAGQITAVEGTSLYNLASDVSKVITAKHVYQQGGPIHVVSRPEMENYRPKRSDTSMRNTPTHLALAGKTLSGSDYLWQVEVFPVPDANFAGQIIYYYYLAKISDLASASDVSIIPSDFHWLPIELAEMLFMKGQVRNDADQQKLDLYALSDKRVKDGIKALIAQETVDGEDEVAWVEPGFNSVG